MALTLNRWKKVNVCKKIYNINMNNDPTFTFYSF